MDAEVQETPDQAAPARAPWRSPGGLAVTAVLVVLALLLVVRLGDALVGQRVFGALDLLSSLRPWSDGSPQPVLLRAASDSIDTILPGYLDIHQRLWSGDLPLATDLTGAGNTLLADATEPVLSPTTFWFLLLPTSYATGLAKLTEVVIAVAGMALWLRRVGTGWPAGLLAGLAYVGTGFVAAWSTWTAQSGVAVLIPAFFWAVERYLALRTARSALPVSLLVGFLLLAGFPAVAGHALYAGGLYFLVRLVADRHAHTTGRNVRTLVVGAGALVLGVGLSAVQFLPQVSGLSDVDLAYRSQQFFITLPFKSFLTVFYPDAFTDATFPTSNLVESYAYLGLGVLVLGAVAVLTRRGEREARGVVPFLVVGLVLSALLVWDQGWWTSWMSGLPIFNGNSSGRLRGILAVFACALAGIGAQRLFLVDVARRTRLVVVTVGGVTVLGFTAASVLVFLRYPELPALRLAADTALALLTVCVIVLAALVARRERARVGVFALVVLLLGVQVNSSLSGFWPLTPRAEFYPDLQVAQQLRTAVGEGRFATTAAFEGSTASAYDVRSLTGHTFQPPTWADLIEAIDPTAYTAPGRSPTNPAVSLGIVGTPTQQAVLDRFGVNTYFSPAGLAEVGPTVLLDGTAEPAAGVPVVGSAAVGPGQPVTTALTPTSVRGVLVQVAAGPTDPAAAAAATTLTATITDTGTGQVLATGQTREVVPNQGVVQIPVAAEGLRPVGRLQLAVTSDTALRLGTFAGDVPALRITTSADDGVRLVYADLHGSVWQRSTALPRIRWASAAEVLTAPADRVAAVADPATPRDEVVLSAAGPLPSGDPATVDVQSDDGDRVRVGVDATGGGYLVVADAVQNGWAATVDGATAPLVAADHAFGGVWVPAGTHQVELRYVGQRLGSGLAVTAVSLVVVLGVLGGSWLTRRRARRAAAAGPRES